VTSTQLSGGLSISYAPDASGNDTLLTIGHRAARHFAFTPEGRLSSFSTQLSDGSFAALRWRYDADGLPAAMFRANGDSIVSTYDAAGRISQIRLSDGSASQFTYSATSGQLVQATSPTGEAVAFAHDGSLVTGFQWSGRVSSSVQWTYDTDFRPITEVVAGSPSVAFTYDPDGLLSSAGSLGLQRDSITGRVANDSIGTVSSSRTFDAHDQTGDLRWSIGGTAFFDRAFTRDSLGRITQVVETVNDLTHTTAFAYDSAGRLASVIQDGSPAVAYQYDETGNRTLVTTPNGSQAASYDGRDAIQSAGVQSYAVSPDGFISARISGGDTTHFTYNGFGQLVAASSPTLGALAYVYDVDGRLVAKSRGGSIVHAYSYGSGRLPLAEVAPDGTVMTRFVYANGPSPAYMIRGASTYRLVTDERGSVRFVVNVSDGSIAQAIEYDSFGAVTSNSAPGFQPFGYAGGLYDEDLGLTRLGLREYDGATGRWITPDSKMFEGGVNLYVYSADDPVNLGDVSGAWPNPIEAVTSGVLGAAFGGLNSYIEGDGFWTGAGQGLVMGVALSFASMIPGAAEHEIIAGALAGAAGDVIGDIITHPSEFRELLARCMSARKQRHLLERYGTDFGVGFAAGMLGSAAAERANSQLGVAEGVQSNSAAFLSGWASGFVGGLGDLVTGRIFSDGSGSSKK
jgi:RHS repeat-associated protein